MPNCKDTTISGNYKAHTRFFIVFYYSDTAVENDKSDKNWHKCNKYCKNTCLYKQKCVLLLTICKIHKHQIT